MQGFLLGETGEAASVRELRPSVYKLLKLIGIRGDQVHLSLVCGSLDGYKAVFGNAGELLAAVAAVIHHVEGLLYEALDGDDSVEVEETEGEALGLERAVHPLLGDDMVYGVCHV